MFHNIPDRISARMRYLEAIDAKDRTDGTPRLQRLRQIPAETGKFIALLAATAPEGPWIEIGTSAGYSTLWLAVACIARGKTITTFEIMEEKANLARATLREAGIESSVELIVGDAREYLDSYGDVSLCFLDAEKDTYEECYDKVVPNLKMGGLLVADNMISHRKELASFVDKVLADQRVDAMIVPVGKGELVCRKV